MKKFLCVIVLTMLAICTMSAKMFIVQFDAIEKGDTLLVGFFKQADSARYNAIMSEWNELHNKEFQTKALQKNKTDAAKFAPNAADKKLAEIEKLRDEALKQLDKMSGMLPADQIEKMRQDIMKQFNTMAKDIPQGYANVSTQLEEQKAQLTGYDDSEFSNEKKYALKRRFAALTVDGKLHGYKHVRKFRNGRAAVSRDVPGKGQRWGFVDESGREVIPCIYYKVYDFYNVTQSNTFGTSHDDADSKGWTTVWNDGMGMVDKNGNVKIPCKFAPTKIYQRIIFYDTPQGEFAQVCDSKTKKYGIIDRSGNYSMKPTESNPIIWYTDLLCFGYRTETGKLVTFDAYGKTVNK